MHDPGSRNCAVFMSYTCINSSESHLQGVAPRSQYSDPTLEAVTLQKVVPIIIHKAISQWRPVQVAHKRPCTTVILVRNTLEIPSIPTQHNLYNKQLPLQCRCNNLEIHNKKASTCTTRASIIVIYIFMLIET